MSLSFSQCRLCLEAKELRQSHLLPAAAYKLSRTLTGVADPNPVVITPSRAFTTSQQVSARLLCCDCEQRFSQNGERWVLAECARPDGEFKLRELLQAASPLYDTARFRVFDVQPLLGSKIQRYLYFAVSVFWRASAHSWKMGSERVGEISLGTEYEEQFRLYLLGKAAFPENARIFVHVSMEHHPDLTAVFPCTTKDEAVRRHKFYIPGLLFILFLGGDAARAFDEGALNGSRRQLMWLCPWQSDSLFLGSLEVMKGSTPSRKLRK